MNDPTASDHYKTLARYAAGLRRLRMHLLPYHFTGLVVLLAVAVKFYDEHKVTSTILALIGAAVSFGFYFLDSRIRHYLKAYVKAGLDLEKTSEGFFHITDSQIGMSAGHRSRLMVIYTVSCLLWLAFGVLVWLPKGS